MSQWHRSPVVLVEDDANDAVFVQHALADAKIGNPLVVCRTADEARRYVGTAQRERTPALFILDLFLESGETGLDFLGWLRGQTSPIGSTPVIMLTGSDEPKHRKESLDLGALFFLQKPITPDRLVQAVQTLGLAVMTSMVTGDVGFRIIQRP